MYRYIYSLGNTLFPVRKCCLFPNVRDVIHFRSNKKTLSNQFHSLVPVGRKNPLVSFKTLLSGRSFQTNAQKIKNRNSLYYLTAMTIFVGGCTYSSVLLYRLYCQATGKGGQAFIDEAGEKIANMLPNKERYITVNFNADVNSTMRWNFKPSQAYIKLSPGETALAFYTALNPTNQPVTGVATYNVLPYEAGKYFNKIQCFCFEEQQLNPNEEVDMPVFFYLDPAFLEDPRLENVSDIILSYTFFQAKEGMQLPRPTFV